MIVNSTRGRRGFTLIELTIVLVVAGLLFAGLFRLLSSGNQSLEASAAAAQQLQLINATKAYLASSDGQTKLSGMAASTSSALLFTATNFSNYLPSGFGAATTNPYNQTYAIYVLKDGTAAGTAPNTYSFMIVTVGGSTIPDAQGGSISSQIGGDGGFIYSNNVCGTPAANYACGTYGAWSTLTSAYGITGVSGHIASRSFVAPSLGATQPWLSRQLIDGVGYYNTMQTNAFLNGNMLTNNFGGNKDNSNITLLSNGNTAITLTGPGPGNTFNTVMSIASSCSQITPGGNDVTQTSVLCPYALTVSGDVSVGNFLNVKQTLYANSDIRLKTNIKTLNDPLSDVMRLNPVSFNYKAGGQKNMGVIAQELEKIYPELVSQGTGMKSVNYLGLIAPLIGAVQELKQQNDDLRHQLHEQSQREDRLEQELAAHKAAP